MTLVLSPSPKDSTGAVVPFANAVDLYLLVASVVVPLCSRAVNASANLLRIAARSDDDAVSPLTGAGAQAATKIAYSSTPMNIASRRAFITMDDEVSGQVWKNCIVLVKRQFFETCPGLFSLSVGAAPGATASPAPGAVGSLPLNFLVISYRGTVLQCCASW